MAHKECVWKPAGLFQSPGGVANLNLESRADGRTTTVYYNQETLIVKAKSLASPAFSWKPGFLLAVRRAQDGLRP